MGNLLEGERVTVYEDPLTEEVVEGEGVIKKVISHHGQYNGKTIYRCLVKFPGERKHFQRKVLK